MRKVRLLVAIVFTFAIFVGCATPKYYSGMGMAEFQRENGNAKLLTNRGAYEILVYQNGFPPGTVEYLFKDGKFVREQYVPDKKLRDYN